MKLYVEQLIPAAELLLFRQIQTIFNALPDIELPNQSKPDEFPVSCHMLARAFRALFPECDLEEGKVPGLRNFPTNHARLLTPTRHIIDLYPIGVLGGPIMIDGFLENTAHTMASSALNNEGVPDMCRGKDRFMDDVAFVTAIVLATKKRLEEANELPA